MTAPGGGCPGSAGPWLVWRPPSRAPREPICPIERSARPIRSHLCFGRCVPLQDVYIVSAVRTAIGRLGGSLKDVPAQVLAATVMEEAIRRSGVPKEEIDQVILGQTRQMTEASNIARHAALMVDVPVEVPAFTVHRQCASGMQAILSGAREIQVGAAEVVLAGGTENLSRSPYVLKNARYGYSMGDGVLVDSLTEAGPGAQPIEKWGRLPMGLTAEIVAERYGVCREDQDAFALQSQEKAARAIREGVFREEIVPVQVREGKATRSFEVDEHPRSTSMEKLAALPPVFKEGGTVTAGNSCGYNDGASAVVLVSGSKLRAAGAEPLARVRAAVAVGVAPDVMGIGPVPATHKALAAAGLSLSDIELVELNEAFAAQCLAVIRELGMDPSIVNVNGGAIALGHPIGATGAVLITKLVHEMRRRGSKLGLATLCIGGGQGMAMVLERT